MLVLDKSQRICNMKTRKLKRKKKTNKQSTEIVIDVIFHIEIQIEIVNSNANSEITELGISFLSHLDPHTHFGL